MPSTPKSEKPRDLPASPASAPTEAEVRTEDLAGAPASEAQAPTQSGREGRIREAAYAAYERRGKEAGREEEDWLEAEKALDDEEGQQGGTGSKSTS
ncbi:DUF2934 domain-containing protein [Variovorax paradoxus]|nr:DUF2934 domain-containing protein [Variovorax paradoxus]